jgi:diguanylate cyclase (GGDEF)-like protein
MTKQKGIICALKLAHRVCKVIVRVRDRAKESTMRETRRVSAPESTPRDTWLWIPTAGIAVVTILGIFSDWQQYPQVAWLGFALNFYAVFAYAATAVLLYGTLRADPRRAVVILAAVSLGMAIFKIIATATLPLTATLPAIVPAAPQTATWLFLIQYFVATCGALEYASSRRTDTGRPLSPRTVAGATSAVLVIVAILVFAALVFGGSLPALSTGNGFAGIRASGVGYAQIVLGIVTIAALLRVRPRDDIDRAVLLSIVAILGITAISLIGVHRYSIGYLLLRSLAAAASSFVLVSAIRRVTGAYHRLPQMQATLDRTERLAVRQSDRLATVWRLVNESGLSDDERIQAIIDAGTAAVRPGRIFYGTMRRVDGDELVIEVVSTNVSTDPDPEMRNRVSRNDRVALDAVFSADIVAANRTIAENDYADRRSRSLHWSSFIGTTFMVANARYVVAFSCREPMTDEPFTDDDLAFVEVLASFIATRLAHNRQEAQIRYQIEHDLLTGLPTRANFRASASQLIAGGKPCAIAIVDLDRFRDINETFGHMIGDAMLVEIGAALNAARSGGDIVARLGGDNFGILIDAIANEAEVEARLQPYRDVFNRPMITGDRTGREALFVGASFGAALFPQDATTFNDTLARADSAVHDAKSRERGSLAFYNQAAEASLQRRRTMRLELAAALEKNQFELYYQPTIEIATGRVAGIEALMRWEHPTLGSVSPAEFIPIAEHSALILPIGRWVIDRALEEIGKLGVLPPGFKLFVNLSSFQLRSNEFLTMMRDHLAQRPKAFHHIAVDINESAAMLDPDRTLDVMAALRELGTDIALDDFGTGYSSLSYVTRFPLNILKIDGRFIERLPGTDHDSALVEVLLGTAQRFGMLTHAEGIETEAQFNWLRERGCTFGQGYYLAAPMTFAQLVIYLTKKRLMENAAQSAFRPPL